MGQPEHGEAGQVDPGGEQSEVGGALEPSADPGPSSAVPAAHQVADLAFDLGSGGGVVGLPAGVGLAGAGASQRFLVGRRGCCAQRRMEKEVEVEEDP